MLHDIPIGLFGHRIQLTRLGFIHRVEQGRERMAQVEAPPTTVTDVEDPLELGIQGLIVTELWGAPLDRMACGSLQAPLARWCLGITHGGQGIPPKRDRSFYPSSPSSAL